MFLSDLSIKRPIFISMLLVAIVLFGSIAFRKIGIDLYPRIDFPVITAVSILPGADPEAIETSVTEPIEEALSSIDSIQHLRSISSEGVSQIVLEFELEKDINVAYQEVQSKLGSITNLLPRDLEGPTIQKFDVDAVPIMAVIVSADLPKVKLTRVVEKEIKDVLQTIPQVGQINVVGGSKAKIWLWMDRAKLEAYNLTLQDVEGALKSQHIDLPAGRIESVSSEILLKTKGEFQSLEEMENLVVAARSGSLVRLKDIGRVESGIDDERSVVRLSGKSAIALLISRQSGANSVEIANRIKAEVKELKTKLEKRDIKVEIAQDNSIFIKHSVDEVRFHLLFGGGLAVLIVLIFLRNLRSTFVCALALPVAVIGTFAIMGYMDFTQNMMTLLALSIAIGLLIDDAIVVQENIIRHMEEGSLPPEAASKGTREITLSVLATTLSVVAVFVPVAFMKGIVGRFFYQFGLTVSFAVLISMFVSFTLNPLFSAKLLKTPKKGKTYLKLEGWFAFLEEKYGNILQYALKYKYLVIGVAVASFMGAIFIGKFLRFEFVPVEDQSEFVISVKAPKDASLNFTDKELVAIEKKIKDYPWVDYLFTTIGSDAFQSVNLGSVYVKMVEKEHRNVSQQAAMKEVRVALSDITGSEINIAPFQRMSGGGRKMADLQFEIRGSSLEELHEIGERIMQKMKDAKGYLDVSSSFETGKINANINIKRDVAADLGISPAHIAQTVKSAFGGSNISTYKQDGDRLDVGLRFEGAFREDLSQLNHILLKNHRGELIPLQNVISIEKKSGPVQIDRCNKTRQITIFANLNHEQKVLGEAIGEVTKFMQQEDLPAGYSFGFTGAATNFKDSFGHLVFALVLAVILVYMVLAAQFESFRYPLIIMLSLPLAIIGAIGALVVFQMTMSIFTMIGIIMLMGLVTKNGILLVDFMNVLQQKGQLEIKEAIIKAGMLRFRPILMTTFAVIFGMLPVAMGGSASRGPMAVAVIGGLITSTILTLVVIPVVYLLMAEKKKKISWQSIYKLLYRRKKEEVIQENIEL